MVFASSDLISLLTACILFFYTHSMKRSARVRTDVLISDIYDRKAWKQRMGPVSNDCIDLIFFIMDGTTGCSVTPAEYQNANLAPKL